MLCFVLFWRLVFLLPQLPPHAPPPPIPSVLSAHFQPHFQSKFPTERIAFCLNEMRTVTSRIPTFRGLKRGVRVAGCLCVLVCTSACIRVLLSMFRQCFWLFISISRFILATLSLGKNAFLRDDFFTILIKALDTSSWLLVVKCWWLMIRFCGISHTSGTCHRSSTLTKCCVDCGD